MEFMAYNYMYFNEIHHIKLKVWYHFYNAVPCKVDMEECSLLWHVKCCNIVCGNICVVYRNIYGLKHIFVD